MSSCAKEACYECTKDNGTVNCTASICDRKLTYTSGNAVGCSGSQDMPDGETHENTKKTFEAAGYTCVKL